MSLNSQSSPDHSIDPHSQHNSSNHSHLNNQLNSQLNSQSSKFNDQPTNEANDQLNSQQNDQINDGLSSQKNDLQNDLQNDQLNDQLNGQLNLDSSTKQNTSESLNIRLLSDAGIYGLCGMTSVLFYQLYPNENKDFCKDTIIALLRHLNLSSNQVKNSMFAFLEGEGGHLDDFINLLKSEETLKISSVPLIEALILFAIRDGVYDARLRVLILKIADLFNIPRPLVNLHEEAVVEMLSNDVITESDEQIKEKAKRLRNKKIKKYLLIGSGTLIGGAALGITGGLIAPAFSIAATTLLGATSAAALGSTTGIAIFGSLFGMAGAGLTGHKVAKRVGDIEEFAFEPLTENKELCITIAVSGWISDRNEDAFKKPWLSLQNTREQYCIRYESNYLLELGRALDLVLGIAVQQAVQEALKFTILSGIMAAVAWPATLITFSSIIDNPWSVCVRRSAEIGRHLAEVLLSREQGKRPVTLIGFSLGARVIFFCLLELAQKENSEGIVQDAYLFGAPVSGSLEYWRKFSKVVSGRIVNGYCRGDWLLKFLYRTTNTAIKIAGLDAIDWKDRRMENVDLSDIVSGHLDYYKKLPEVLKKVGVQVNENELNKSSMKKSATGMPQLVEMKNMSQTEYSVTKIRMAISEPNLSSLNKSNDEKGSFTLTKLERSLSLEDLQMKHKKSKMRLSSTCVDFKKFRTESLCLKDNLSSSNSSSIDTVLSKPTASNERVNKLANNNQSNDKKPSVTTRSRLSRFNILSRFRKTENIEEINEENHEQTNEVLKDELTNSVEESKKLESNEVKLNNELLKEEILKDKEAINDKIANELKNNIKLSELNELNELSELNELNDSKTHELNRKNQMDLLDSIPKPKRNDTEFIQLNVESLNLKNSSSKRRI